MAVRLWDARRTGFLPALNGGASARIRAGPIGRGRRSALRPFGASGGFILAAKPRLSPAVMGQELKMVEQTSGFWADAIAVAASPVAITAGVVRGSYEAASGAGPFTEGFHAAADPVIASARKFGTEHQDTITKGIVGGAATALGARILGEGLRYLRR